MAQRFLSVRNGEKLQSILVGLMEVFMIELYSLAEHLKKANTIFTVSSPQETQFISRIWKEIATHIQ